MYVLIINAYKEEQKLHFDKFFDLVKLTMNKHTDKVSGDDIYYVVRSPSNLDDYIYENDDGVRIKLSELNNKNKLNFEQLDFVFIDGCEKYLPWKKAGSKLVKLIKLCVINNKNLFSAGVGTSCLIYLLSLGLTFPTINIINAESKFQSRNEIEEFVKEMVTIEREKGVILHTSNKCNLMSKYSGATNIPLYNRLSFGNKTESTQSRLFKSNNLNINHILNKNDYFLDFPTGDIYEHALDSSKWFPSQNIGLHKLFAVEKYSHLNKLQSISIEKLSSPLTNKKSNLITSRLNELIITIDKLHCTHHLFENVSAEFVTCVTSRWFAHKFMITDVNLYFSFLAGSKKGPMILERGQNVGVFFHPRKEYEDSAKVLENFITNRIKGIKKNGYAFDRLMKEIGRKTEEENSFKNKMNIVDVNEVNYFLSKTKKELERNVDFLKDCRDLKENEHLNKVKIFKVSEEKKKDRFHFDKESLVSKNNALSTRPLTCDVDSRSNKTAKSNKTDFNKSANSKTEAVHRKEEKGDNNINVFSIMFPYVREQDFPKSVVRHIVGSKMDINKDGKEVIRLDLTKKSTSNYERLFKQYEGDLDSPIKKSSIAYDSPYSCEKDLKHKEFLESKAKWLGSTDFKKVFGKHTTNLKVQPSLVSTGSPYTELPFYKQFRESEPKKWINKKNFKC